MLMVKNILIFIFCASVAISSFSSELNEDDPVRKELDKIPQFHDLMNVYIGACKNTQFSYDGFKKFGDEYAHSHGSIDNYDAMYSIRTKDSDMLLAYEKKYEKCCTSILAVHRELRITHDQIISYLGRVLNGSDHLSMKVGPKTLVVFKKRTSEGALISSDSEGTVLINICGSMRPDLRLVRELAK